MPADGATWTKVTAEYDAPSGKFQIRFDDNVVAEETFPPAQLSGTGEVLRIGGNGPAPACPVGGNFAGTIDEVSVSRIARHIQTPPPDDPGGAPDAGPGNPSNDAGPGEPGTSPGGCCDSGRNTAGSGALALLVLAALRRRPRRAHA
jgi:hypothetical protein